MSGRSFPPLPSSTPPHKQQTHHRRVLQLGARAGAHARGQGGAVVSCDGGLGAGCVCGGRGGKGRVRRKRSRVSRVVWHASAPCMYSRQAGDSVAHRRVCETRGRCHVSPCVTPALEKTALPSPRLRACRQPPPPPHRAHSPCAAAPTASRAAARMNRERAIVLRSWRGKRGGRRGGEVSREGIDWRVLAHRPTAPRRPPLRALFPILKSLTASTAVEAGRDGQDGPEGVPLAVQLGGGR